MQCTCKIIATAVVGLTSLASLPSHAQTQDLFVSSGLGLGVISRFAGTGPGTFTTTASTVTSSLSAPEEMAFDSHGNLFVADFNNNDVVEFAAGAAPGTFDAGTQIAAIDSNPAGLAFDPYGNLYVGSANGSKVTELVPGTTPGVFSVGTTIATAQGHDFSLAFNARGDLFLAGFSDIAVYAAGPAPGTFGPATSLAGTVNEAILGLAFDGQGNLFAASSNNDNISEYVFTPGVNGAAGTFGAGAVVLNGLSRPLGLAFDAQGDLFAANNNGGSVAKFAYTSGMNGMAGTFGAEQDVETGLSGPNSDGPRFLTFGPATPAVPEASTTVSFGLLLALGGIVLRRSIKRSA